MKSFEPLVVCTVGGFNSNRSLSGYIPPFHEFAKSVREESLCIPKGILAPNPKAISVRLKLAVLL